MVELAAHGEGRVVETRIHLHGIAQRHVVLGIELRLVSQYVGFAQALRVLILVCLFAHGHHIGAEGVVCVGHAHAHVVVWVGAIVQLHLSREVIDTRVHVELCLVVLVQHLILLVESHAYLVAVLGVTH